MSRSATLALFAALGVAFCAFVATRTAPGPSPLAAPAALVASHARPGDLVVVYPHRWHFELDVFGDIPAISVTEVPVDIRRFNRVFVVFHEVLPEDGDQSGDQNGDGLALPGEGPGESEPIFVASDEVGADGIRLDPTRFTGRGPMALLPNLALAEGSADGSGLGPDRRDVGSGPPPPRVQRPLRDVQPALPVDETLSALFDEIQRGRERIFAQDVGAFTVELWQSRDAAVHVADLADLLPTARVRLEPRGDEPVSCPWTGDGFVCPDHPWVRVERVADNFAGQPVRCVWSHPAEDADLVITFPRVRGATHIEGWYGHTDYAAEVYTGSRTVLDIEVDRGSRRFTAPRDRGRRALQWRLPRRHDGPLTLRVHAERPDVAHFCWDLRLVHRVGVR